MHIVGKISTLMHFISHERRQRTQAFEQLAESAAEALKNSDVVARLGARAGELALAAAGLFLPSVRGGTISLPRRQRDTNGFALVPLTDDECDGNQRVAASMYLPTKQRTNAYRQAGGDVGRLATISENWTANEPFTPYLWPGCYAVTYSATNDSTPMLTTRPVLYVRSSKAGTLHALKASVVTHELTHGLQREARTEKTAAMESTHPYWKKLLRVGEELEANYVGAVILESCGLAGLAEAYCERTMSIEYLRRTVGLRHKPFIPGTRLLNALENAGFLEGMYQQES